MFKSLMALSKNLIFLCLIQTSLCKQSTNSNNENLISAFFVQEEQLKEGDIVGVNKQTGKTRPYRIGDYLIGIAPIQKNKKESLVSIAGTLAFNREQVDIYQSKVFTKDGQLIGQLLSNKKVFINISSNISVNPILKKVKVLRSLIKAEKLRNEIQTKQINQLQTELRKLSGRR